MGMLLNGQWANEDNIVQDGRYIRQSSVFGDTVTEDIVKAIAANPNRFHLIASHSCPWSHSALLLLELKKLNTYLPVHIAHGPRMQGYALNGGASWNVPGTANSIVHLHELYTLSHATYTGRSTVPILWDSKCRQIVSNESTRIIRAFDAVRPLKIQLDFTLFPERLQAEIEVLNTEIYEGLSNGVYSAAFAERQSAYDLAVEKVFNTLDKLEVRLSIRRYLLGQTVTEADWRLFPTLMRFDAVYYVEHKCSYRRLVDYPHLWAYARDLYSWRGVNNVINIDTVRRASYSVKTAGNPEGIVAVAPEGDWSQPHNRDAFGPARIALRSGNHINVEPTTFSPRSD